MILLTILIFFVVLGVLVLAHEFGHFIMARRMGMRVEEFGFGFPPRLFGIKRGGTIYSFNLIPFGGFVKILGENGESNESDSFASKSALARFIVLIAGVTMNAILAWVLLSFALGVGTPTLVNEGERFPASARVQEAHVALLFVKPDSPASEAGLKAGDQIRAIDGQEFQDISDVKDYTSLKAGEKVKYTVVRGKDTFTVNVIPRAHPPEGEGPLGVALGSVALISYPWYEAIWRGLIATASLVTQIVYAFISLIGGLFTGRAQTDSLTGPIGIAVLTRDAARLGFVYLMQFTAVLSVNLAVLNILPFPALDGGRVMFLAIERLRRKKLDLKFENYANTIGFMLLLLLLLWVTTRDIGRFSSWFVQLWERFKSAI